MKPIAPNIVFQTIAQASNPVTFSNSLKEVRMVPLGDQNKPADGRWKLTLNKEPPPGMPLVMLVPVSTAQYSSTSDPTKRSQNFLPSSLVLESRSSAPHVISMPVVPPGTVISKEEEKDTVEPCRTYIPSNTLIPVESHNSSSKNRWTILEDQGSVQVIDTENVKAGEQAARAAQANQGMKVTTQVEVENEQKNQSNLEPNALRDEKSDPGCSSDAAPFNSTCPVKPLCLKTQKDDDDDNIKKKYSNLTDLNSSPVMAEVEVSVPFMTISDKQMLDKQDSTDQRFFKEVKSFDRVCDESQMEFTMTGDTSESGPQGQNESGFDVEVEMNEDVDLSSMEVEIGDEDSGVDMLDGELHECVTCGQVLPEKDMIQHYMKHAAVTDSPECSPTNCSSRTTEQSPPCSPSRKRLRSGTKL